MKKAVMFIILAALLVPMIWSRGKQEENSGIRIFKVWWYDENNAMAKSWEWTLEEFKRQHPDVIVEFEQKGFEQIMETANMVLNSDEAPDLMETNKGNGTAGLLVRNGLLSSLDDVAKKRGWLDVVTPSFQTTCRYDQNGLMSNNGELYSVTTYGEYVMVYYNKDIFSKFNLKVPTSLEEFEAVCDTLVKNGVTPLTVGAGDKWPITQNWYTLSLYKADREFINNFQFLQEDIDFMGPEFSFGMEKMAEHFKKGYYPDGSSSITYNDSNAAFFQGNVAMNYTGSWNFKQTMDNVSGFDWGVFLMPGKKMTIGSGGNLFVVPKNAKNKDLAYDFIDIALSVEAQNIMANAGGIPVASVDYSGIEDVKIKELNGLFGVIKANDGLAFYPDWPIPDGWAIFGGALQEVAAGTMSPREALSYMQEQYYEYKNSLE